MPSQVPMAPASGVGSYSGAHAALAQTARAIWPATPWLPRLLSLTAAAAFGTDMVMVRRSQRMWREYDARELPRQQAELYRKAADEMSAARRPAPAPAPAAPSRYLLEEGAARLDEDCFSCATAHAAAVEGALLRAAAAKTPEERTRWLNLAVQEPSALFARDWTPERYSTSPPEQRAVIDRFAPRLRDLQRRLLGGGEDADVRATVVEAAACLKEAPRFTAAGDPITHPEVEWRRLKAEADLAAAERVEVGILPPEQSTALRRLRQRVGSGIGSAADLTAAAQQADQLSRAVVSPAVARLQDDDIEALRREVASWRSEFAEERRRLASPAPAGAMTHLRPPTSPPGGRVRVSQGTLDRYTRPTQEDVALLTDPTDLRQIATNLERAAESRGIPSFVRNLPSTGEGSVEGYFDPETGAIVYSPAVGLHDTPYTVGVRLHETAHALNDTQPCNPRPSPDHAREEERAELVQLCAATRLGLPVELWDGTVVPPGERELDWARLEAADPDLARDVRWSCDWESAAARGETANHDGPLATQLCPALRDMREVADGV